METFLEEGRFIFSPKVILSADLNGSERDPIKSANGEDRNVRINL